MSRLILLHFILSDARNPWGIKREEVHLGFCLKIQKGKHKILISIYWSFFTSILYQLKWRETSCDPGSRGIKDRKKRQARGKENGDKAERPQLFLPQVGGTDQSPSPGAQPHVLLLFSSFPARKSCVWLLCPHFVTLSCIGCRWLHARI